MSRKYNYKKQNVSLLKTVFKKKKKNRKSFIGNSVWFNFTRNPSLNTQTNSIHEKLFV